jgi:hypothetical protein
MDLDRALVVYVGRRQWQLSREEGHGPRYDVDVTRGVVLEGLLLQHPALNGISNVLFVERIGTPLKDRLMFLATASAPRNLPDMEMARVESEAVMALRAVGRTTGLAMCVDWDECRLVAVREGVPLAHTVQVSPLGDASPRCADPLQGLFRPSLAIGWKQVVDWSVQRLLWLGRRNAFADCPFGGMPRDLVRMLARYLCTEYPGVHECLTNCLAAVHRAQLRQHMRENVVLFGDKSQAPGLVERLRQRTGVEVWAVEGREHLPLNGAIAIVMQPSYSWVSVNNGPN